MNTAITIFNTSKPCYRLKAKVIERNISLTQTHKSITFNELREKNCDLKFKLTTLVLYFAFLFFQKNSKFVGILNCGTKHEYHVKKLPQLTILLFSANFFLVEAIDVLRFKRRDTLTSFVDKRQKRQKRQKSKSYVQGGRHVIFLPRLVKMTPPSPLLSTIDCQQKPLTALLWKFVTTNQLSTCFSLSLATSKSRQYSVWGMTLRFCCFSLTWYSTVKSNSTKFENVSFFPQLN